MASNKSFYEQQVKDLILTQKRLFGRIGASSIVYEKSIPGNVIADCLIFTEYKGVIGIEIKTAHDTTRRLNKQLSGYSRVCRFVYVLCDDSQVESVEKVINTHHHNHVGIISYDMFGNSAVVGIYRPAYPSPYFNAFDLVDILWKVEISQLLGQLKHPARYKAEATGKKSLVLKRSDIGESGSNQTWRGGVASTNLRKPLLIRNMIGVLGEAKTAQLITDYFVNGRHHPEKVIKFYHFRKD